MEGGQEVTNVQVLDNEGPQLSYRTYGAILWKQHMKDRVQVRWSVGVLSNSQQAAKSFMSRPSASSSSHIFIAQTVLFNMFPAFDYGLDQRWTGSLSHSLRAPLLSCSSPSAPTLTFDTAGILEECDCGQNVAEIMWL